MPNAQVWVISIFETANNRANLQNSEAYMKVAWKYGDYNPDKEGTYKIEGVLLNDEKNRQYNPQQFKTQITVRLTDDWSDELEKDMLVRLTFDDEQSGFVYKDVTANIMGGGTPELVEDAISGKALQLDGSGGVWLDVKRADGSSILKGEKEITISFYSRPYANSKNWALFAAPDDQVPILNYEVPRGKKMKYKSILKNKGQKRSVVVK